jgi:hypothetical protein
VLAVQVLSEKEVGTIDTAQTLATSRSAVALNDNSGIGRKQLLTQTTPRFRLGVSVRLRPGRPQMPEPHGYPPQPVRLQQGHVGSP